MKTVKFVSCCRVSFSYLTCYCDKIDTLYAHSLIESRIMFHNIHNAFVMFLYGQSCLLSAYSINTIALNFSAESTTVCGQEIEGELTKQMRLMC